MTPPSKELLSAVLGIEVLEVGLSNIEPVIQYRVNDEKLIRKFSPLTPYINIYELAFRVRDYFKDRYNYELPMNGKVEEIFTKAAQLHESML